MNYGLIQDAIEATAYLFGDNKVPYIFFNESGNWELYLPTYECQADNYETNGCTVWGTQNQIETFHNFLYETEPNYSERFTYVLTPVDRNRGCDPQKVYECIRKYGMVDNKDFPTPKDEEEFHDESEISGSLLEKGKHWLTQYDLKHEWLWTTPPSNAMEILKEALKTSPIACSVTAWYRNEEGKYYDNVIKNNHWVMIYRIDYDGIHIFDSYDLTKKTLTHDHYIKLAKRIFVNKKNRSGLIKQRNLLIIIRDMLLFRKNLLTVIENNLGIDASPADIAPDELGCAETVTTILKQVYPETPIMTGTWGLYDYLRNPKNGWEKVEEPQEGCVVISPTGLGKKGTHGHVGFVLKDNIIASNSSWPNTVGKFLKNFTVDKWVSYYGGMNYPTFYYRKK